MLFHNCDAPCLAGAAMQALAKGAVRFSRRYSVKELRESWQAILYDPVIAKEATARIVEAETASADSSRANVAHNLKDLQEVVRKRPINSVRTRYHKMRKRSAADKLISVDQQQDLQTAGTVHQVQRLSSLCETVEAPGDKDVHHVYEVTNDDLALDLEDRTSSHMCSRLAAGGVGAVVGALPAVAHMECSENTSGAAGDPQSQHPDFRHRRTKDPLWLTNQDKIQWANSRLGLRNVWSEGCVVQWLCEQGQLEKALGKMSYLDEQQSVPSVHVCRALLRLCSKRKALAEAKRVVTYLTSHGLEFVLGEYMVLTLVRCGGLDDAIQLFNRLHHRTALSWTALISGFTKAGQCRKALELYRCMLEEGVEPDNHTFVSLLQACSSIAELEEGKRIHAEAWMYGCGSDLFVCTCLVDMYAQCGSMECAQTIFESMLQHDVVVFTTMLSAYAQQGEAEKALLLYEQMQENGLSPDTRTLVGALQACATLAEKEKCVNGEGAKVNSLQKGKSIHADARRKGLDSDVFVRNSMVTMYGKCGSILDAQLVFEELSHRDVVSWTAILAAYCQQGQSEKAVVLYAQMLEEGVSPTNVTIVVLCQACGMLGTREKDPVHCQTRTVEALHKGKVLHALAWRKGYQSNLTISNTLISMYGRCGSVLDAHHIFDSIARRNVVSWSAMILVHVHNRQAMGALEVYEKMKDEDVCQNHVTFLSALKACGTLAEDEESTLVSHMPLRAKSLELGKAVHADAWLKGYYSHGGISTTLVSMYGRCGSILDAKIVFDWMSVDDVILWNSMMGACVQQGHGEEALQLYQQMRLEGMSPNDVTFVIVLQICGILAGKEEGVVVDDYPLKVHSFQQGRAVHADVLRLGYSFDFFVGNTLVSMYARCGSIVDAENVFDELPQRTVVSWNVMLAAYVERGNAEATFQLYSQMKEEGTNPDEITLVYMLQACCDAGSLDVCRQIHVSSVSVMGNLSPLVRNTLIHAYGKCASMVDARTVFDAIPEPDVVSWTALIAGYAREGDYALSLKCFEEMLVAGSKPNEVTFLSVLSACSHAGLPDKGIEYFESMSREYGLTPNIEHYITMVDILGRAGYFTSLQHLLSIMPIQPNLALWLCLLSACRKHGMVVLAKQVFDKAIALESKDAVAYVLMANIYADAGLAECAKEINLLEQRAGTWKKPSGKSWIEHENEIHAFVVEDQKLTQHSGLFALLQQVLLLQEYEHRSMDPWENSDF